MNSGVFFFMAPNEFWIKYEFWIRVPFEFWKFFGDCLWVNLNSGSDLDLNSVFLRIRGESCELTPNISNQIKTTCINHVGNIIVGIKNEKSKGFFNFFYKVEFNSFLM